MEIRRLVELVHHRLSSLDWGIAIHSAEFETAERSDELLEDVEHNSVLGEEEGLMPCISPKFKKRTNDLHLAGFLAVAIVIASLN